jgi:hypothetical protein
MATEISMFFLSSNPKTSDPSAHKRELKLDYTTIGIYIYCLKQHILHFIKLYGRKYDKLSGLYNKKMVD